MKINVKLLLNINAEQFILVGNVSIYNTTEAKLLGVTFDSALKFDAHVSNLCKKSQPKPPCPSTSIYVYGL